MRYRCAVLDDYQGVATELADWSLLGPDVEVTVFTAPLGDDRAVSAALADYDIVCLMRERTKFPKAVIDALPRLRLIVSTGMRNAALDVGAALARGIVVSGTGMGSGGASTPELAFAHMLELARGVGANNAALKSGKLWQAGRIGTELGGSTLGLVGLGHLGRQMAGIGRAFGMRVIAWSPNLTPDKCAGTGAEYATREALFSTADYVSVHLVLGDRSRGLIGAADFALMKPTAFFINTSRGPIVDEAALIEVLSQERIAGAGLDVFDQEPLPPDHPLRSLPRAQLTPHLGYVTRKVLEACYRDTVEDISAFLAGHPIRLMN